MNHNLTQSSPANKVEKPRVIKPLVISAFHPKALNSTNQAGLLAFPTFADLLIHLGTMVLLSKRASRSRPGGITVAGTALVSHEIPF